MGEGVDLAHLGRGLLTHTVEFIFVKLLLRGSCGTYFKEGTLKDVFVFFFVFEYKAKFRELNYFYFEYCFLKFFLYTHIVCSFTKSLIKYSVV